MRPMSQFSRLQLSSVVFSWMSHSTTHQVQCSSVPLAAPNSQSICLVQPRSVGCPIETVGQFRSVHFKWTHAPFSLSVSPVSVSSLLCPIRSELPSHSGTAQLGVPCGRSVSAVQFIQYSSVHWSQLGAPLSHPVSSVQFSSVRGPKQSTSQCISVQFSSLHFSWVPRSVNQPVQFSPADFSSRQLGTTFTHPVS